MPIPVLCVLHWMGIGFFIPFPNLTRQRLKQCSPLGTHQPYTKLLLYTISLSVYIATG